MYICVTHIQMDKETQKMKLRTEIRDEVRKRRHRKLGKNIGDEANETLKDENKTIRRDEKSEGRRG